MNSSLVIIFNQDFSKNIEKLEFLYSSRFDRIRYLVPTTFARLTTRGFRNGRLPVKLYLMIDTLLKWATRLLRRYTKFSVLGTDYHAKNKPRIIQVVGDQYYFYHYISQASKELLKDDSEWFWFVGDDAVLNTKVNQENFFDFLNINDDVDVVLCKPVIATDRWLETIQDSVTSANEKVAKVLGTNKPYEQKLAVEKEDPDSENQHLCVACADFFGVRRDVLERSLESFDECFKQRVFVEVCVPNVLLKQSTNPVSFSNFTWVSQPSDEELKDMARELQNSDTVFAHPIKLSSMTYSELQRDFTLRKDS
jgi:hypothetical protein